MFYNETVLDNGVTVITEHMDGVRSASMGLWVRVGNRDEGPGEYGMSHFMEHMLFKGTPSRTARDISMAFDAIGAEQNAFTAREYTCFHARMVDEHLPIAFDILSDMLVNASFAQETIDPERNVVLEEIARSEDDPDESVYDLMSRTMYPDHPLGRPILGTRELVSGFETADMRAYHDAHYTSGNVFVSVAGNVDHEEVVELARRGLAALPSGPRLERTPVDPGERGMLSCITKDTVQAHVLLGFPALERGHRLRQAYGLLDGLLGGSMSSRLFQEIREKRGLVYTVYTAAQMCEGIGCFSMYAGTRPENVAEVVDVARREFEKVVADGIGDDELERVKELVCGTHILSMESTKTHMLRLGKFACCGIEQRSLEESLRNIRAVTKDEIAEVAHMVLTQEPTVSIVSPYTHDELKEMF